MQAKYGVVEELRLAPLASGPLSGKKFAVKDLFAIRGRVSGFGCPSWSASHDVVSQNAPVIEQLRHAGGELTCITVSDELAFSLDGLNTHFVLPINKQSPDRICGGSSSGSASACAHGVVDFALGTDTAGSVRVPAAYCGLYGLRTTHGAISLDGVLPLGPSFDTVGVLSRDADVLSQVSRVLLSHTTASTGVSETLFVDEQMISLLDPALQLRCEETISEFGRHFGAVKRGNLDFDLASYVHHFGVMRGYEAWQAHGIWWQQNHPRLLEGTAERLLACREITLAQYRQSTMVHKLIRQKMVRFFQSGGAIFTPTVWQYAPLLTADKEELATNRQRNLLLGALASFAGLPQISIPVPIGAGDKYPATFGFSIIGPYCSDVELVNLAYLLS